jgi:hypothetical protein
VALCLEPHDLAASKLVAYREEDIEFIAALVAARLIDPDTLSRRVEALPVDDRKRKVLLDTVDALRRSAE